MAKVLFGCYRMGDANDPEIYTQAVVAVLSDYPDDVITRVVDPRKGLPSRQQFLPTVAEVKAACEEIYQPIRRRMEWDTRAIEQVQDHARLTGKPIPTALEVQKMLAARGLNINVEQKLLEGPGPK